MSIPSTPELLQYAGDFRSPAVQASARLLAHVAGDIDAVPVSACMRIDDPANERACRRLRARWKLSSVGGIVVLTLALLLFATGILLDLPLLALVAGILCILIIIFALLEIAHRSKALRRVVAARGIDVAAGNVRGVSIENALTFSKMKVVPEDLALLWIDPQLHCVRLEGLSHRYIIYATDVVSLSVRRGPAQSTTSVTYRIGPTELSLTLSEIQGNVLEIYKQSFGLASRMHPKLVEALTAPEQEPIVDAIAEP